MATKKGITIVSVGNPDKYGVTKKQALEYRFSSNGPALADEQVVDATSYPYPNSVPKIAPGEIFASTAGYSVIDDKPRIIEALMKREQERLQEEILGGLLKAWLIIVKKDQEPPKRKNRFECLEF